VNGLAAFSIAPAGTVLLPARKQLLVMSVADVGRLLPCEATLFSLRCDFAEGGPWAGTRDLVAKLLEGLDPVGDALLIEHDYELVHVLPDLKATLGVRNPNLTDIASDDERVRNYPADRAMRLVHGLIDLVIALKERSAETADRTWTLLCVDYDRAGHISQVFFRELMRRAGRRLRLLLIPLAAEESTCDFSPVPCQQLPFAIEAPARPDEPDSAEAAELARALEARVSHDTLLSTGKVPDLIRLWTIARRPEKVFQWQCKALHAFNNLGLYADALHYGEPARRYCNNIDRPPAGLCWGIFHKLFMSYLGINDPESARRLAEEYGQMVCEDTGESAILRISFCYMVAMLHARYLPARDFAQGEHYLELGVTFLAKAGLRESDHYFMLAFNRNGLAMIRSFQGRQQEALELCRNAWKMLDEHLDSRRHRLHRSVLLYNMAQVYNQIAAFALAIEQYTTAISLDPNYSEYYNERGNLLLKLNRLEEADQDYRRAIALGPPYFEVWSNLGQCCRLRGRIEEAIGACDRSLDLQPNQPMAWMVRAQALQDLDRREEAIESYGRSLSLQPTLWPAYAARAVLLYEQGKLDGCLADLDRAIALAPDSPDLYQNRAVAHAELGNAREASHDLRRYLDLLPEAADRAEVEARLESMSLNMAFTAD
jgi:tetratricopeptide (TPR) repeat protein